MKTVTKILTSDNKEFSCERDAKHHLQNLAEEKYIKLFRDLDTLPSRATKLLWLTDNYKLLESLTHTLREIALGVTDEDYD